MGPVWFPAAMGTGILATLLQQVPGGVPWAHRGSVGVLGLAWAVLTMLVVGFAFRTVRDKVALTSTLSDIAQLPFWGTVSMGILAVGSATATVVPAHQSGLTTLAWHVDLVMWLLGTLIGMVAALGFTVRLLLTECGEPSLIWGLAVVGPMVSATTGAALAPHVPGAQVLLLLAAFACFVTSLVLGVIVFAVAYHLHWRGAPVPLAASCSTWIPLGMIGQSTAAAQTIATAAAGDVLPATAAAQHTIADVYGVVTLLVGVPMIAWAVRVTLRGFRRRMPFSPGWWALTFPIGTLSLGAVLLGRSLELPALTDLGLALTLLLVGTVTLCLVATLRAVLGDAARLRVR